MHVVLIIPFMTPSMLLAIVPLAANTEVDEEPRQASPNRRSQAEGCLHGEVRCVKAELLSCADRLPGERVESGESVRVKVRHEKPKAGRRLAPALLGHGVSTVISECSWSARERCINRRSGELVLESKLSAANQQRVLAGRVNLAHMILERMVSLETEKSVANLKLATKRLNDELNKPRARSQVAGCDAKYRHDVRSGLTISSPMAAPP